MYTWSEWCPTESKGLGIPCFPMLWGDKNRDKFKKAAVKGYSTFALGMNEVNIKGASPLPSSTRSSLRLGRRPVGHVAGPRGVDVAHVHAAAAVQGLQARLALHRQRALGRHLDEAVLQDLPRVQEERASSGCKVRVGGADWRADARGRGALLWHGPAEAYQVHGERWFSVSSLASLAGLFPRSLPVSFLMALGYASSHPSRSWSRARCLSLASARNASAALSLSPPPFTACVFPPFSLVPARPFLSLSVARPARLDFPSPRRYQLFLFLLAFRCSHGGDARVRYRRCPSDDQGYFRARPWRGRD